MHNTRTYQSFCQRFRIITALALVSMLTISAYSTLPTQINAFDMNSIGNDNGISGFNLGNLCFASDCTNQNIQDNQNSPVVTDSDNTNIESGTGSINHSPRLGDNTNNPIVNCFKVWAPGGADLDQFLQAVRNFIGLIPTDNELKTIAAAVNYTGPLNTPDDIVTLATYPGMAPGGLTAIGEELAIFIDEAGFPAYLGPALKQCMRDAIASLA